jgi:preprotein translocase subunit SecA
MSSARSVEPLAVAGAHPDPGARWYPPRETVPETGRQWSDWFRWLRFATGQAARSIRREAAAVHAAAEGLQPLSEEALTEKLVAPRDAMRRAFRRGVPTPRAEFLQAIAIACEFARRTVGMTPYQVQIQAVITLLDGCAAQMNAGEGKTLSVALAAALHGLAGRHCHVVTANDYLAARDVELMRPLFDRCGLRASALVPQTSPDERRRCYDHDLVYGTGKELLADFLRDQIASGAAGSGVLRLIHEMKSSRGGVRAVVMRGLDAAIVDEADSVLIDEATTPLIISAGEGNELLLEAVTTARGLADQLVEHRHYRLDRRFRDVEFTDEGKVLIEEITAGLSGLWRSPARRDDLLGQAVIARDLFELDRHYIIDDGEIVIVDENTGRTMPGRSWSYGLHQAIEARAGVEMTEPARTLSRMSFQDFYARYQHLSGASGTLQGIRFELWRTYGLPVVVVPPRLPSRLTVPRPRHFATAERKHQALVDEVVRLQAQGHAVLVGTRRIDDSEHVAEALAGRGVACSVLNAKQHEHEAEVISAAGAPGVVTVATNMAGRGTDIKLTEAVIERGGLQVLMIEPHESARVDWQLFGRAGRQGQAGRAQAFVSLEDDLIARHTPWVVRPLRALARIPVLRAPLIPVLLWFAQARAQALAWSSRRTLRSFEKKMNKQLSFVGGSGKPAPGSEGSA